MLNDIFAEGVPVYVAMSGGKDSVTIAHLCEPWIGKFKLLWVNTGFNFPHVEAFIRALGNRYGMHEIQTDLRKRWEQEGIPGEIVPINHWLGEGPRRSPKMQPWTACCTVLRAMPMREFLINHGGPVILLHGQRTEDGAPNNGPDGWQVPEHVKIVSPIKEWSTSDVLAYLVEHNVPLPAHYAKVHSSLDCWICPALFSHAHGAERLEYMKREYPEMIEAIKPYMRTVEAAARSSLDRFAEMVARA